MGLHCALLTLSPPPPPHSPKHTRTHNVSLSLYTILNYNGNYLYHSKRGAQDTPRPAEDLIAPPPPPPNLSLFPWWHCHVTPVVTRLRPQLCRRTAFIALVGAWDVVEEGGGGQFQVFQLVPNQAFPATPWLAVGVNSEGLGRWHVSGLALIKAIHFVASEFLSLRMQPLRTWSCHGLSWFLSSYEITQPMKWNNYIYGTKCPILWAYVYTLCI